jgi:hypothetical protein
MKVWTDDLMPSIEAFAHMTPNDTSPITTEEYNAIVHLAWVPAFVDLIQPYRESPDIAPDFINRVPTPFEHRTLSPSDVSVTDAGVQVDEDANHPGNNWMLYNNANTDHYKLIFSNEQGQAEIAKYIRYISVTDGMAVQGCRKKGDPIYGMSLHARAFPHPNLYGPGTKDSDLTIFHPSSVNRHLVDDALIHLLDAGVVADIHTYRA